MFDSGNVLDLSEADSQQQKRAPVTKATFTGLGNEKLKLDHNLNLYRYLN